MKSLTVIVPAYQVQDYLREALDSLLVAQVLPYLEVLVVDDGSTDRTGEIALTYQRRYPQVFRYLPKKNGGHGSTINLGMQQATGAYLKVLDGDDWFRSEGLLQLMAFLQGADQDVVLTPYETYNMQTQEVQSHRFDQVQYHRTYRAPEDPIPNSHFALTTVCYRTDFLRGLGLTLQENTFYVDEEFIGIPLLHLQTWAYLPEPLYVYRIGNANQSVAIKNRLRRLDHSERVIGRLLQELQQTAVDPCHQAPLLDRLHRLVTGYALYTLIYLPDRARGRALFLHMWSKARQIPQLERRCRSKARLFQLLHALGVGGSQYDWLRSRKSLQKYRQAEI